MVMNVDQRRAKLFIHQKHLANSHDDVVSSASSSQWPKTKAKPRECAARVGFICAML